jgi:CheY-like chemotaxis protein/signal recognition particle receptor subunit beta
MASVNPLSRELVFKIVYYGPGLGGKTTTLEHIHATAKPELRGKLVSLATPIDRTLYFDFLPIRLPPIRGMNVRLQLFTVPGQVYFNATRKLVLTGSDGIVFVSDSQAVRADANVESLENLRDNLVEQGRDLERIPLVFQYNKRDLPDVLPVEELEGLLNPRGIPFVEASAKTGEGVYEALEAIRPAVPKASSPCCSKAVAMATLLIVDDDPTLRDMFARALSALAQIDQASGGGQALKLLAAKKYDLVLLDLHMPVIDGLVVLQTLTSKPGVNHDTPVYVVTADTSEQARLAALRRRATFFLTKPVSMKMLLGLVESVMKRKSAHPPKKG